MPLGSRQDSNHYAVKVWPPQENPTISKYNVKHRSLIDPEMVYLPPLHIKLGLMKKFVKAMDSDGRAFAYLKEKFGANKSDAKLTDGIFI